MRSILNVCAFLSLFAVAIHAAAVDQGAIVARDGTPVTLPECPPTPIKFGVGPVCRPRPTPTPTPY